jgi:hypothetical protein
MTILQLPFTNKLAGTYTKKVSFKTATCLGNNQYTRKLGIGLDSYQISYDLKYLGLTDSELAIIENLFSIQNLGDVLSFKAPFEKVATLYLKPSAWSKENTTKLVGNLLTNVTNLSFTLMIGADITAVSAVPPIVPVPPTDPSFPPVVSNLNYLLQFTSLPLFDSITPSSITITSPISPTLVTGVFGNALTFNVYPISQTTGLLIQTPIVYSGEDFTLRFRLKNLGSTIYNYSHHFQVNNYDIVNSAYYDTNLSANNGLILTSYAKTYFSTFKAVSFEVFNGVAYLYFDGTLVTSWTFVLNNPTVPLSFGFGVGSLEFSEIFLDELAFFDHIALASGASSYTVETSPYL